MSLVHRDWVPPVSCPVRYLRLIASDAGLHAVLWPEDVEGPGKRVRVTSEPGSHSSLDEAARQLEAYFQGRSFAFDLPLVWAGTDFQQRVWRSLADIPLGETRSYLEQAIALGKPNAIRAVAAANGRNPFSIVLPCHRVIGSNGKLTGYAGGLPMKSWLLQHEASG